MATSADTLPPPDGARPNQAHPSDAFDWLVEFLKEELAFYPGRAAAIARTVTACVITAILVMIFRLPNGFLGIFYVVAIARTDPRAAVRNGFYILLGNIAAFLVAVAGIALFLDYPLPRFIFIVGVFFLAFFVTRALANPGIAFGFTIIVVAAVSVPIIWARPNPLRLDLETTVWTTAGIMLGTLATMATEWVFGSIGTPRMQAAPPRPQSLFVADAFTNPEYVSFAIKGCLAASICYVFWNAVAWPGLGVSTVTCVIVAPLGIPGSARQRLITRFIGLLLGGVVFGIGSEVFLIPRADSIVGFVLPLAAIIAIAAWFATSGPRLSYLGRQLSLTYCITIFQVFGPNASLVASRDRLCGILLGIVVTWLVFDVGWN